MREITRDIVGGFIFSSDGKVLLGHNVKGGVYEDSWVVPGGGVEQGETKSQALAREMQEEVGIDISAAEITPLQSVFSARTEKTLRDTGERVLVHMTFYDSKVQLAVPSDQIVLAHEDDFMDGKFFSAEEVADLQLSAPTRQRLVELGVVADAK